MSIEQLIATQASRTAGPSPMQQLSNLQSLKSQQLQNTAGAQSLDQNKRQRGLEFAANVGQQIKAEQDPMKKAQVYSSALQFAKMNGHDIAALPQQYSDQAQQFLDTAYMQVYAPTEFQAKLNASGFRGDKTQSSKIYPDGTVIQSTGTGVRVLTAAGEELQGKAAMDAVSSAMQAEAEQEKSKYSARAGGTVEGQRGADKAGLEGEIAGAKAGAAMDVRLENEPELKREIAKQTVIGKGQGEAEVMLPETIQGAEYSIQLIDKMMSHPGLDVATGASSRADPRNFVPGTDAYDFNVLLDQIQGRTFLQAFESLKGGGQITETEGKKATQAMARLNKAQSKEAFLEALQEFQGIIRTGLDRAMTKAGKAGAPAQGSGPQAGAVEDGFRFKGGDPADPANWEQM